MTLKIKTECIEVVFDDEGLSMDKQKYEKDAGWQAAIELVKNVVQQCSTETVKIKEAQKWKLLSKP